MRLILRWLISAAALLLLAEYLPGIHITGWYAAFVTALVLGLVNAIIRPVLIFFTLPITILTLGLFTLVLNAFLFWFTATIVKGFTVDGFTPAFLGALIMTLISWLAGWFFKE